MPQLLPVALVGEALQSPAQAGGIEMNDSCSSFFKVSLMCRPGQNTAHSTSGPSRLIGVSTVIAVALPSTLAMLRAVRACRHDAGADATCARSATAPPRPDDTASPVHAHAYPHTNGPDGSASTQRFRQTKRPVHRERGRRALPCCQHSRSSPSLAGSEAASAPGRRRARRTMRAEGARASAPPLQTGRRGESGAVEFDA